MAIAPEENGNALSVTFAGSVACPGTQRELALRRPRTGGSTPIPSSIITPIKVQQFAILVAGFPDVALRDAVLHGLRNGFDIGFQGIGLPTRPRNLRSARDNADGVSAAVAFCYTAVSRAALFTFGGGS